MAKKTTITLATLDYKLDLALEKLIKHEEVLDGNGKPGLIIDVDRLKQEADSRKWHVRSIWGAFIASIIAYFVKG